MGNRDPRVDAYIARSAPFAQPILTRIRETVHEAYPDIEEGIKWGVPHFLHRGIVAAMASFKAHCRLYFWKGALIVPAKARRAGDDKGMDRLQRLTSLADLPPKKTIVEYVKAAVKLNDGGVTPPRAAVARKPATKRLPLRTPPSLSKALARNRKAKTTFDSFSPSHRREYIEWITEAKTPETRDRRIEQALGWMAEGKSRNWKYIRK
jgi:uncharacterized protein YdeI (YjbR/CyaY-like superfamily)